jgi:hypothetical protein
MTESGDARGFIVGAPRSGTTLLMNLVAGHPEIAPIYETGLLRNLLSLCERAAKTSRSGGLRKILSVVGRDPLQKKIHQFVCKVLMYYQSADRHKFGKTKDEFFPFGNRCIEYTFCELVRETEKFAAAFPESDDPFRVGRSYIDQLFGIHCARMNRRYWVNKTPSLVRSLESLNKMYPEAALIHIVRDGRDVALSTISLKQGPNTARAAARRWRDMVRSGRRLCGNAKYLEVRYEDLIAAPDAILQQVFTALGVDRGVVRELPGLRIYRHRKKVWRAGLAEIDRRAFAEEGGDLLIELGYEKDDAWIG